MSYNIDLELQDFCRGEKPPEAYPMACSNKRMDLSNAHRIQEFTGQNKYFPLYDNRPSWGKEAFKTVVTSSLKKVTMYRMACRNSRWLQQAVGQLKRLCKGKVL